MKKEGSLYSTIGLLGTGSIAAAIATGLSGQPTPPSIVVSSRSESVANNLAASFSNVTVAQSNQELVNACDVVVISLRLSHIDEILAALAFREGQTIINLVSGLSLERLRILIPAASTLCCAVPLPAAARQKSVTAIFPPNEVASAVLSRVGSVLQLTELEPYLAICALTGSLANYYKFASVSVDWLQAQGIGNEAAQAYTARLLDGAFDPAQEDFGDLISEHATPGGLNAFLLEQMEQNKTYEIFRQSLDGLLRRLVNGHGPTG
jgi:pyrroline-5-carboxylate reductase